MSAFEKSVNCKDIAPLLVFYTCDEVSDRERKEIEAHVENCAACAAQLAEENDLQEAMVAARQPADELDSSGILLSQCRSELAETLDGPAPRLEWRAPGPLRDPGWNAGTSVAAEQQ